MTFEAILRLAIILLSAILAGYAAGRRSGLREGCRAGLAEAPLRLKEKTLLEGECPVCGTNTAQPTARAS